MRLKIIVVFFRFEIQKQFLDKLTLAVMQKRPNHDLQYFKRRFSCA